MIMLWLILMTPVYAGNSNAGWSAFAGSLGGSVLGNVITAPRQTRTQVVTVQQPAPAYDDTAATIRKMKRQITDLQDEIEELSQETAKHRKENKKLKAENAELHEELIALKKPKAKTAKITVG